jgi:hypothetical protein
MMPISFLSRLFNLGRMPSNVRTSLESEGILVLDENIRGWVIFKDFKAPGKRFKYRAEGMAGFLVVTRRRVFAQAFGKRVINVLFEHPKFALLHIEVPEPGRIEISFEAADFHEDRSGRVVVGFKSTKAEEFARILARQ